jgi:hypothetical protein
LELAAEDEELLKLCLELEDANGLCDNRFRIPSSALRLEDTDFARCFFPLPFRFTKAFFVLLPTSLPAPPKTLSLMAEESVSSVSLKMRLAKESSFFSWSSSSVIEFARLLVLTEAAEELLLVSDALRFFPLGLLEGDAQAPRSSL